MTPMTRITRPLLMGAVVIALASASGCSWFRSKTDYTASGETRPLEVPPDLDLPDSSAATVMPVASNMAPMALGAEGRLGEAATVAYPKIGSVLEGIAGVVINGRAEALGSYDVTYKGASFLIRVLDSAAGGSRMVALSPDGRLLNAGPAAELMAAIKAKL